MKDVLCNICTSFIIVKSLYDKIEESVSLEKSIVIFNKILFMKRFIAMLE